MKKTLMMRWCDELCSAKHKPTLSTINQDSKASYKLKDAFDNPCQLKKMGEMVSIPDAKAARSQNMRKPMQSDVGRTFLMHAPMCGAYARQTGKPCKMPAMKGKERCRLHGGKSTGRPIHDGLRTQEYKKHKMRLKLLTSLILHG